MAWLVAHMWMALTAAAAFALILGWTVRGMLVTSKMRRAIVERDVAHTELEQARDEIERLFAAQRAQKGEGADVADTSARKIADLTSELEKSKSELAALKSKASQPAPPAEAAAQEEAPVIVRAPGRAGPDDAAPETAEAEDTSLLWRNRHLEGRVKHLEALVVEAAATAPVQQPGHASADPNADEEGIAKLKWQVSYLKQRVEALESELAKVPAELPEADAEPEAGEPEEDGNEELARLRWRNRYLEGRLAYFEGGATETGEEAVADAVPSGPTDLEPAVSEAAAPSEASEPEPVASEPAASETVPDEAPASEPVPEETVQTEADEPEPAPAAPEPAPVEAPPQVQQSVDPDRPVLATVIEAEPAGETVEAIEDTQEPPTAEDATASEDEPFADVSNDEEESLAEADHASEDVLSDEEYAEEDVSQDQDFIEDVDGTGEEEGPDEAEDTAEVGDDREGDEETPDDVVEDEMGERADVTGPEDAGEAHDQADDEEAGAEVEVEDEVPSEDDTEEAPGEGVSVEQPMAMDGPVEGHPDDLTLIGGIGPKIQILLNELGIWHYDQIAAWTPENVAWIDQHLNFNGRITREGWVEQAGVLVADAEESV